MDIAWHRPHAADAAARLASPTATPDQGADDEGACAVLRVPVAGLDRAWQRSAVGTDRLPDVNTTAASITFGRTLATLQRTRTADAPLVRYAVGASGNTTDEIEFVDGRDTFAAAMALGASEVEIVVPRAEAHRFLADVGGQTVD